VISSALIVAIPRSYSEAQTLVRAAAVARAPSRRRSPTPCAPRRRPPAAGLHFISRGNLSDLSPAPADCLQARAPFPVRARPPTSLPLPQCPGALFKTARIFGGDSGSSRRRGDDPTTTFKKLRSKGRNAGLTSSRSRSFSITATLLSWGTADSPKKEAQYRSIPGLIAPNASRSARACSAAPWQWRHRSIGHRVSRSHGLQFNLEASFE